MTTKLQDEDADHSIDVGFAGSETLVQPWSGGMPVWGTAVLISTFRMGGFPLQTPKVAVSQQPKTPAGQDYIKTTQPKTAVCLCPSILAASQFD